MLFAGIKAAHPAPFRETDMIRSATWAMAALLSAAVPCLAQPAPPPGAVGFQGNHSPARACMTDHLGSLRLQVHDHMAEFHALHPDADRREMAMERHGYMRATGMQHRAEIGAAMDACGLPHHHQS